MRNPGRLPATCHPEKLAYIKGLCRPCYRKTIITREQRDKYNKRKRDERAEYRKLNPIIPKEKKTPWHLRNKDKVRRKARERNLAYYGITPLDYDMMLQEQGGVCAICERPPKNYSLNIDHEHQKQEKKKSPESRQKRVRGLLCHRCNRALGLFGNSPEQLLLASTNFSEYIVKYYSKRMVDSLGLDDAIERAKNTLNYLEAFEKRRPK